MKLGLSQQIFEKYSKHQFHENPSCGGELFHADGRTDRRTVAFRNFVNAPKNAWKQSIQNLKLVADTYE